MRHQNHEMTDLYFQILGFVVCATVIIFSGTKLSYYGDIIAELTGMGKAWFGLIMMAAVTSLPELFTGVSSIIIVDTPDIAVGDIMGSCAFNLLILAILDGFVPNKPLSSVVTKSHLLAGFLGIFLITHSIIAILFEQYFPVIGWYKGSAIVLIGLYLVAVRLIFKNEQKNIVDKTAIIISKTYKGISKSEAIKRYILFAIMVVIAALALPFFADKLADEAGLSKSFVGTFLVAVTTSLPELVVAIAAVRLGSMDIAVGNLLGSNIFNMLILALDDLMYAKGPLLSAINPNHALSGLVTLLMTAVVGIGILYSSPSKGFVLGIDAVILVIIYITLILALYSMR